MTLLVDTHILLWALTAPDRLTAGHREALEDPTNTVFASAIENGGFDMPAFTGVHAASVRTLPFHHSDPFDRMIIAQAIAEGYTIVTADSQFSAYPVEVV